VDPDSSGSRFERIKIRADTDSCGYGFVRTRIGNTAGCQKENLQFCKTKKCDLDHAPTFRTAWFIKRNFDTIHTWRKKVLPVLIIPFIKYSLMRGGLVLREYGISDISCVNVLLKFPYLGAGWRWCSRRPSWIWRVRYSWISGSLEGTASSSRSGQCFLLSVFFS